MPTINLLPKKPRVKQGKSAQASKLYNTTRWRRLRLAKLAEHPLCEMCEKEGKITPATDVHHILPIQSVDDELAMRALAFDYNNLQAICQKCHYNLHNTLRNHLSPQDTQR